MTESVMEQKGEKVTSEVPSALINLLKSVISVHGLELVDVEVGPQTLIVFVDKTDGTVDLDTLAHLSKEISSAMDDSVAIDKSFSEMTLEVSTPGLERPLKRREHYDAVIGAVIAVRLRDGFSKGRRLRWRLVDVFAEGIVLEESSATSNPSEVFVAFADIDRAHTVFEWKRDLIE